MRAVLACLFCLLVLLPAAQAQSEKELLTAAYVVLDARVPVEHPRLMLQAGELADLRSFVREQMAQPDKSAAPAVFRSLILQAGGKAPPAEPVMTTGSGAERKELWRKAYQAASDGGNTAQRFALGYLITGDEAQGREAVRWLLALCSWDVHGAINYRDNDEAFVQSLRPMLFAYDWIQPLLTADERATVQKALMQRLAILSDEIRRKIAIDKPTLPGDGLSHQMRFISTLGQGGLALYREVPAAREYLAWAYSYYLNRFPIWGGDDGGWSEGLDYWATGNSQHLRFLEGLAWIGLDAPLQRPFWRNTGYFAASFLQPYDTSSFADLTNITRPNANRALLLEKLALINRDPLLMGHAHVIGKGGKGGADVGYPTSYGYYELSAIDTVFHLWRKRSQPPLVAGDVAAAPRSRHFRDIGWVALHAAPGNRTDDIMFGFKSSPIGSISHGFSDQNAFVINAFGEALAISSGYREWYGSPHHEQWTRSTRAKNAVLIDGRGVPMRDATATGRISRFVSGDRFDFVSGDASQAYRSVASRVLRHVLFVDRRYFVMLDEIDNDAFAQHQWMLHARDAMKIDAAQGKLGILRGKAGLQVQLLEPQAAQLKISQTDQYAVPLHADYLRRMPAEWHATVETLQSARTRRFLSVMQPWRDSPPTASAVRLPASSGFALQLGQDTVLMAEENQAGVLAGAIQLQGRAAFINPDAFALIEGMGITHPELRLQSSVAISIEGARLGKGWQLQLAEHAGTELSIAVPNAPGGLTGLPAGAWQYDAAQGLLRMRIPGQTRKIGFQ